MRNIAFTPPLYLLGLLVVLFASSGLAAPPDHSARTRNHLSHQLDGLIDQNHKVLKKTDLQIKTELSQKPFNAPLVSQLIETRKELLLRQGFFYSLNNQIAQNYKGQKLRTFFSEALSKISENTALSEQPNIKYIEFLSYLNQAIQTIPEPREDLIAFIEGYVRVSTLSKPLAPKKFITLRDYTNGAFSLTNVGTKPENLGDGIDKELKAIDLIEEKLKVALKRKNQVINNHSY